MGTLQLIQITPEELTDLIGKGVKDQLTELKNILQPHPEQLLTREQTAQLLQVDKSTLWHWTKKGKIQAYGLGNRVFYKRSEIEAALTPINNKR